MSSDELSDYQTAKSVLQPFMAERVSEHRDEEADTAAGSERLGDLCISDDDFVGALAQYRRAQTQGADTPAFLVKLAAALEACDDAEAALETLAIAFEREPLTETALAAADAARSLGMRRDAEDWMNRAIALSPDAPYPWFKLSKLQREAGRRKDALKSARFAAKRAEEDPFFWMNLGEMALDAEEWVEAAEALRRTLDLNPTDHEAMTLLGIAHWRAGKREDGIRSLRLAMELEPEPRLVPGLLSVMLRTIGHDEDAEAEEAKLDRLGRYDKEQLARLKERLVAS